MTKVWLLDKIDYPGEGGIYPEVFASEEVAVASLKSWYPSPPNKVRWTEKREEDGDLRITADFYEHVQGRHTKHVAEWSVFEVDFVTAVNPHSEPTEGRS